MDRKSFIRLVGLTSFGLMAGSNLFASALKMRENQFIEIKPPNVHVRHGFFNLQVSNENGLHIHRDIFNQNGLEEISEHRMVSIKISEDHKENFGIINKKGFQSKSKRLSGINLKANSSKSIKVNSPSFIFSEYDDFLVDGIPFSKQQAVKIQQPCLVKLTSKKTQHLIIYSI